MKKILFLLLLILCACFLFAQEEESAESDETSEEITEEISEKPQREKRERKEKAPVTRNNVFFGIGPEINAYTREGVAIGGTLLIGYELAMPIDFGLRTSFFNDLKTVSVLEMQPFFRYYLPWVSGLFVEADVGIMLAFEDGELFPAFAGGASAGYRLHLNKIFVDFGARFGYPHIWAVNAIAGLKIPLGGGEKAPKEPRAPREKKSKNSDDMEEMIIEQDDEAGGEDE